MKEILKANKTRLFRRKNISRNSNQKRSPIRKRVRKRELIKEREILYLSTVLMIMLHRHLGLRSQSKSHQRNSPTHLESLTLRI